MTKLRSFAAAAILCFVLTPSALAQEANRSDPRPSPFTESFKRWDGGVVARGGDTAFWPSDLAAGAAIGSAGAIATAPSRGDSNAYYNNGDPVGPRATPIGTVLSVSPAPGSTVRTAASISVSSGGTRREKTAVRAVFFVHFPGVEAPAPAGPLRTSLIFDRRTISGVSAAPDPVSFAGLAQR